MKFFAHTLASAAACIAFVALVAVIGIAVN